MDASEDSQLRAAIAASLACTSTQNEENSDDDNDEDFDDLEFSGSDSEEERKTPQKNNKSSTTVKKEVKREINFDEATDNAKGACDEGDEKSQNEHFKGTDSVKKTTAGVETHTTNKLENSEAEVSEADSTSEEKDDSLNHRTQEQAGKGD